jgi:hypothetical protein
MATTFAVPDGRVAMNAVARNGFGTSGGSITSLLFQPDYIWEKTRSIVDNNVAVDSVRGVTKYLVQNNTSAEGTNTNYFTSFNSNGYTLGSSDYATGVTVVDWCWKAGGTAVSNTSGTITSSVSANTTAGFSVVTYTGTGANATVGHGLGVAPSMVIVKHRNAADAWYVYHVSLTSAAYVLQLNTTIAQTSIPTIFNSTAPTNSVFSVGTDSSTNTGSGTYVAYCWAPVAGYSAFGSYTGNGSADGPFIYTGFRPRFLMIKSSSGAFNWFIEDSSRNTTNVTGLDLSPNLSDAEANNSPTFDFLSNGFKLRNTYTSQNGSGTTYIYAAYAENPLKYANAR